MLPYFWSTVQERGYITVVLINYRNKQYIFPSLLFWPQIKLQGACDGRNLPAAGLDVHVSGVTGICEGSSSQCYIQFLLHVPPHYSDPENWCYFCRGSKQSAVHPQAKGSVQPSHWFGKLIFFLYYYMENQLGFVNNGIMWWWEGFTISLRCWKTLSFARARTNLGAWLLLSWHIIFSLFFTDCCRHHCFGVVFHTLEKDSLLVQEGNGHMHKMFLVPYQRRYLRASALEYCCQRSGTLLLVWVLRKRRRAEWGV